MKASQTIVVAGTDTGVGKTVFAAGLVAALGADYWKPVQSGLDGPSDSELVEKLAGLAAGRLLAERYRLKTPVSPHLAAEIDGVDIDVAALRPPEREAGLVVELAGGLMVPLTRETLQIDVVSGWRVPVVLVARTALGTINHTLLSLEALRRRGVDVLGVAFVGPENADSERTIAEMGLAKRLGRLPIIEPMTASRLAAAFSENFRIEDFA